MAAPGSSGPADRLASQSSHAPRRLRATTLAQRPRSAGARLTVGGDRCLVTEGAGRASCSSSSPLPSASSSFCGAVPLSTGPATADASASSSGRVGAPGRRRGSRCRASVVLPAVTQRKRAAAAHPAHFADRPVSKRSKRTVDKATSVTSALPSCSVVSGSAGNTNQQQQQQRAGRNSANLHRSASSKRSNGQKVVQLASDCSSRRSVSSEAATLSSQATRHHLPAPPAATPPASSTATVPQRQSRSCGKAGRGLAATARGVGRRARAPKSTHTTTPAAPQLAAAAAPAAAAPAAAAAESSPVPTSAAIVRRRGSRVANTGVCASRDASGRRGARPRAKVISLTRSSVTVASAASDGASASATTGATASSAGAATSSSTAAATAPSGAVAAAESNTSASTSSAPAAGAQAVALQLDVASGASAEDESDMGRLQALLEARGIPPHLLGALGPRMQHMLHRSIGSNSKVHQLVQGVQSGVDENQQLQAVIELGQLLVMGNEETLAGFPIKQVVPPLIQLLHMEHNFDMMNHACRALTYLMEALPRSTAAVVEAVPALLQKLQSIQCIDVAEQALSALELLSRRHAKNILQVGGISSCLVYVDFFSITAQRAALTITANCCQCLTADQFHLVQPCLTALSQRLSHQDKKTIESVCLTFSRLVDTFRADATKIKSIADYGLLCNVQQLLLTTPSLMGSGTFCELLKLLRVVCGRCPELAVQLLSDNIANTICSLMASPKDQTELVARNPEELHALTSLVGELLPALPTDGLFAIDQWLLKVPAKEVVVWLWKDDKGNWRNYSQSDSFSIEYASQLGAEKVTVSCAGRQYCLDLVNMCQVNETSGNTRPLLRRAVSLPSAAAAAAASSDGSCQLSASVELDRVSGDARLLALQNDPQLLVNIVRSLFPLLYKVYSCCAGPAVRHTCLRTVLRMLYYTPADLIKELVSVQELSAQMTGMLSSSDLKVQVAAVQLTEVLFDKLPELCQLHFRREGVVFQMNHISKTALQDRTATSAAPTSATPSAVPSTSSISAPLTPATDLSAPPLTDPGATGVSAHSNSSFTQSSAQSAASTAASNSASERCSNVLSDVLKRKRSSKRAGNPSRRCRQEDALCSEATSKGLAAGNDSSSVGEAGGFPAAPVNSSNGKCNLSLADTFLSFSRSSTSAASSASATSAAQLLSAPSTSSGAGSAGRFHSSFLASLNPARWGRSSSPLPPAAPHALSCQLPASSSASSTAAAAAANFGQRERVRVWLRKRAEGFVRRRFRDNAGGVTATMARLQTALSRLRLPGAVSAAPAASDGERSSVQQSIHDALTEVSAVLCQSDISPFEVLQSGLIAALTEFLTADDSPSAAAGGGGTGWPSRRDRLRAFLLAFAGCSPPNCGATSAVDSYLTPLVVSTEQLRPLSALVAKLQACVSQSEQLPVKVHDLCEAGTGLGSGHSALRYFNQNQLKCNLYRWPGCTSLRQWRGGPVKIDPLALVQAIERYLVIRGYGRQRDEHDDGSDDADSEDDIDGTMAAVSISQGNSHRLQFVIDNQPLPYNMTVFQAVQQFSQSAHSLSHLQHHLHHHQQQHDSGLSDWIDSEHTVDSTHVFQRTHTIYYRPAPDDADNGRDSASHNSSSLISPLAPAAAAPAAPAAGRRHSSAASAAAAGCGVLSRAAAAAGGRRRDELWSDGLVPERQCPLAPLLTDRLPPGQVTVADPSLAALNLLRVLHALSRHYGVLYQPRLCPPLLCAQDFINAKVAAKASRQLQDAVIIMTGNCPQWLFQLGITCPFLFPFDTRQLLFYSCTFDRDRALMRLIDSTPELQTTEPDERVVPKLERKKRSVSRADLLRQAETLVSELSSSRALLEVHYDGEVGSGLGPTLEFYSQVCRQLRQPELALWRANSDHQQQQRAAAAGGQEAGSGGDEAGLVSASLGLYPLPLPRNAKASAVTRSRAKFKFIGKLMAKALMDSRLLDLPLAVPFYRWLLRQEHQLSAGDVAQLEPQLAGSLQRLRAVAAAAAAAGGAAEHRSRLTVDGCAVEDLGLDFTLPGHPAVELRRGGRDMSVTVDSLHQYLQLLSHWLMYEGVHRQMEAFREGFESVFPIDNLAMFMPEEMDALFCGSQEGSWDEQTLRESFRPDHGYSQESAAIAHLVSILATLDRQQRRSFLSFVTGCPRLPVGGFRALSPPLTVVRKTVTDSESADDLLPSVMTCVNYLKLPDYSSRDVMQRRLLTAINEGRLCFMLS